MDGTIEEGAVEDEAIVGGLEDGAIAEAVCKACDERTVQEAVGRSCSGVTNVTDSATVTALGVKLADGG